MRYYEIFFDSPDLNDFWGTSETHIGHDVYELCAQSYFVAVDEDDMIALSIDPDVGIADNEEMELYLSEFHYETPQRCDDLVNCVNDYTRQNIFAFQEIDESEFESETGIRS